MTTMTTEKEGSQVSASRRRELRNLAKGKGRPPNTTNDKGETKEAATKPLSGEDLANTMLAAETPAEFVEWSYTCPGILSNDEIWHLWGMWQFNQFAAICINNIYARLPGPC